MFQQVVFDMGSTATSGNAQSLRTSSVNSYIRQLYFDSFYVDNCSSPELRISIKATGVSTRNTMVFEDTNATGALQKGGREIFEIQPFGVNEGRQLLTSGYPLLDNKINLNNAGMEITVTDWTGAAITWDRLVLFCRAEADVPESDDNSYRRVLENPAHRRAAMAGFNEF